MLRLAQGLLVALQPHQGGAFRLEKRPVTKCKSKTVEKSPFWRREIFL